MKLTVFVLPDGSITGSYSDLLQSVLAITPVSVKRVTSVDWDLSIRAWRARTLTGKPICSGTTRDACLRLEAAFVERLLGQFYMCRRPDGDMWCPDCNCHIGSEIHLNCPHCGFEFPMVQHGFTWKDFQLDHLVPI